MKHRNKVLIILGAIFFAAALTFLILGFALSGADILGWFTSKWAYWFYTFIGIYILVIVFVLVSDKIKKL